MVLVFVYRWEVGGEGDEGEKRWWQMMFGIITLRFILLLHCFYLCPLCGLAERWAIFWRSTQLNKMISNQQTAREATLKTRTALQTCTFRAIACARWGNMQKIFDVLYFLGLYCNFYNPLGKADSDIFNCLVAWMTFLSFFFKLNDAQIDCAFLTEGFLSEWTLRCQEQIRC